jgi:hypothetical protein
MSDDSNQIVVPPSFTALFVPPGRIKPSASREHITERYEYCEDLATMLTDTAQTRLAQLRVTEDDVLQRIRQGLANGEAGVDEREAGWVIRRLMELLGWAHGE